MITKEQFDLSRKFIYGDIQRELDLARASEDSEFKEALLKFGVEPGGGNFLAALAMLCYTEFGGQLLSESSGMGTSKKNFELFLRSMGPEYQAILDGGLNVYDDFRCGMAHSYFAKGSITVSMYGSPASGLGKNGGKLFFCLEKYFEDFKIAFDKIGKDRGYI